ncbi:uncharacterized protein MELLADRAFT_106247 [Melampsora larici-populina 98AG31]|uniref:Uncharacterized protein n=1 Tax=Melampsora larici-populina (strain 98AG31 / pathotype 3-4-7) TaxID=747676 RepID=F4RKS1_MELLP|nr:uncharacterized protein MELLADRAFT_106247 [Melampsora larici-populina 98AG31]EGG06991.1 hypothetical protein MELLADRAFT_106247 [Melampsora larici-populina 98AG31]
MDASLVYTSAGEDTIRIKVTLINASVKYPIPFDESQHGPPVNIHGAALQPQVIQTKSQAGTSTQQKQPPPAVKCAQPSQGPTAARLKSASNLGCTSHYCRSCFIAFDVPGGCYKHWPKGPDNICQPPAPTNTPQLLCSQPAAMLPEPKQTRVIPPAQCSQSV